MLYTYTYIHGGEREEGLEEGVRACSARGSEREGERERASKRTQERGKAIRQKRETERERRGREDKRERRGVVGVSYGSLMNRLFDESTMGLEWLTLTDERFFDESTMGL